MSAGWPRRLLRAAPWLLAAAVLWLVARQARTIDWAAVLAALQAQSPWRLAAAAALAGASHALYASYDLIGRHLTGHRLGTGRTLATAAISYAVNLNFGALVGGMALRLRLYTGWGLDVGTAVQAIGYGMLTNWVGYLGVAGAALLIATPPLPADWPIARAGLQWAGGLLVALQVAYLLACATLRRRRWAWRGHHLVLPTGGVALWQASVAGANWALMGVVVWVLLAGRADYGSVLAVLMLAAVAGVITHVPAGLGVLEGVFMATLGGPIPPAELLAALLAYRAAYYLLPLVWALPGYAVSEAAARRA